MLVQAVLMGSPISRYDLQSLASTKLSDSQLLFENGRNSNAYYLAGYSIELGLKACIARIMLPDVIPDKQLINSIYVHDLNKLLGVAGLRAELENEAKRNPRLQENWDIVAQWTEESRYQQTEKALAHYLLSAVVEENHGIFPWIKKHW